MPTNVAVHNSNSVSDDITIEVRRRAAAACLQCAVAGNAWCRIGERLGLSRRACFAWQPSF